MLQRYITLYVPTSTQCTLYNHTHSTMQGTNTIKDAKDGKLARFLLATIWHQHKARIFFAFALQIIYSGVSFVGPMMLNQITKILTQADAYQQMGLSLPQDQITNAWLFAMGMFLAPVVGTLGAGQSNRVSVGTQIMVRAELTAAIYRKALRMSTRSRQATETGRVVNLMSADVNQLQSFLYPFAAQLLTGPAMLIASLVLLWFQIKWATFIGLGILLLSTPATTIFLKKLTGYRREMLKYTDQRVKLMNQLLVGIRVLKMYAWEAAQEAAVLEIRKHELGQLRKAIPMRVGMQTLLFAAPTLAMVVCFVVYGSVEPNAFTPASIFTSISLFALMRFPLIFLPFALIQFVNALVSMRRLTQYFMLDDRKETVDSLDGPGIQIVDGSFYWSEPPPKLVMPEIGKKKKGGKEEKKDAAHKHSERIAVAGADTRAKKNTPSPTNEGMVPSHKVDVAEEDSFESGKVTPSSISSDHPLHKDNDEGDDNNDMKAVHATAIALPTMTATADPNGASAPTTGIAWELKDVDLSVSPGELVCVVGRVGSGKSSLVQAVLGEMEVSKGTVAVGGSVAYAAQQAWIINATVMDNVTFGNEHDEALWEYCVDACCLSQDIEILPAGAMTEIGEKGINLSGGQKQRISLARALYQDADVYILDDPLSAVDVHVGKHIFEKFINGAIKDKARLLVTNQLQYLPYADKIIMLDAGRVVVQGTYEECQENGSFARLLSEHNAQADDHADDGTSKEGEKKTASLITSTQREKKASPDLTNVEKRELIDALSAMPGNLGRPGGQDMKLERGATFNRLPSTVENGTSDDIALTKDGDAVRKQKSSGNFGIRLQRFETMRQETSKAEALAKQSKTDGPDDDNAKDKARDDKKGGLIIKEDQEVGQVTGKVYWKYIKAYGVFSFASLVFLWSTEQTVRILTNWYLSQWTQAELKHSFSLSSGGAPYNLDRGAYIGGYLGLAFGFVLLTAIRAYTNLMSALQASRIIHFNSLTTLVRAPVTFFDTTPVGRILNRFSKDTDDVDFLLSMSMTEFGNCIMQLLATLIFLAAVQPIILAGIVPLMVIYWFLQRYYRRSYIEMQRIDSVSRSPIYAHFSESLAGVETIRAYRLAEAFAATSDARVDANHRAYFTVRMANEWLSMRLDCIGACIVFLTAVLAIVERDSMSASLAALTLSEALDVTLFLKSAVTSGAMFETRFNSVERLSAYWDLPQEAPAEIEEVKPDEDWPTEGAIEYQGVWMRYRPELDPVLRGVDFTVNPGDKIGIVGRTGSGKSSLIVTLFRLVEPFEGRIMLDGVDLLTLGLNDVRGRIAAIPQDPVLFSGTIRSNLDPYERHSDAQLWDALSHVALKETVAALPEGLSARVAENGENFSVGQRQLLCVGRALLRDPRVLVADEATASVDSETDALIQRTIRREFKHCTVLTIAHRINTILDSTKVLVMDAGVVKEFDPVPVLMSRTGSSFRAMVVEAGLESPAMSRGSSYANMQTLGSIVEDEESNGNGGDMAAGQGRRRLQGLNTFVTRMKKYGVDE